MASTILKENSLLFPVGTTAQRPGTAETGDVRYNTTVDTLEYYNGTEWIAIGLLDGSSDAQAAPSASYIKTLTGTNTTGMYWIKNNDMTNAVEVYCDMTYDGGGWMLAAYGYVASTVNSSSNYAIPNMNHDGTVYSYNPTNRASNHGLIQSPNSQKSTLLIAKQCSTMLMAAGNNPSTGGIDNYSYVYKVPIATPSALTFENHGTNYMGNQNVITVTVAAVKGDSGTYTRYSTDKSLGVSWGDSYPTGYGVCENSNPRYSTWNQGPMFPSVHPRDSGWIASPDVGVNGYRQGNNTYTFRGWYRANNHGNTGQTSLWFK